jgi:5-methylcytosine-specific restriction endonuclease McrA
MLTHTKPKTCQQCNTLFAPLRPMAVVCSPMCAIKLGKAKKAAAKVTLKARKTAIKTRREWHNEAQTAVNAFVRERDAHLACVSCGRFHKGQWHAGHFRSRGSAPHLALEPKNIHRQCAPCNVHLHGNSINFRAGLIARFGNDYVQDLESDDEPRKPSIDDLIAIRHKFIEDRKQLIKEQA